MASDPDFAAGAPIMHPHSEVEEEARWHAGHAKCPVCKCCISMEEHGPFRDDLSFKEFGLSGMCQKCQDDFFGRDDD